MSEFNISYDSVLWMIVEIPDAQLRDKVIRFIASSIDRDTGVDPNSPELLSFYDIHQSNFEEVVESMSYREDAKHIADIIEEIREGDLYESCHSIIIE